MTTTAKPTQTREYFLSQARSLLPVLKERALEAEQLRRVPEATVRDILDLKLNRISLPKRFGGYEVDFDVMHDVAIELGQACGATSWCFSLWGVHNWWVGYYPPQGQEEVFSQGPDTLLSTAGYAPHSAADPVAGGFRVSGRWEFSSGCDYASWFILQAASPNGPVGVLVPKEDVEIIEDSWYVSGLQGSGSKDIVVKDAFVPTHRTLRNRESGDGVFSPYEYHQQRRYSTPLLALVVWDLVAPAIGIAAGAVEEFTTRLIGTSGRARAADSPLIQIKIAESAAEVDAARALLHKDIEEAQQKGERGETLSPLDMARYARDKAYAVKLAIQSVNRLFEVAGGHALYLSDPLQRMHRDVQACGHRDGLVFDFGGQRYGRAVLGLDPIA